MTEFKLGYSDSDGDFADRGVLYSGGLENRSVVSRFNEWLVDKYLRLAASVSPDIAGGLEEEARNPSIVSNAKALEAVGRDRDWLEIEKMVLAAAEQEEGLL